MTKRDEFKNKIRENYTKYRGAGEVSSLILNNLDNLIDDYIDFFTTGSIVCDGVAYNEFGFSTYIAGVLNTTNPKSKFNTYFELTGKNEI